MVQTQPKFIANRDIFEKREKKAKLYSWVVFCIAEIVAELPYLLICAGLFWACWSVIESSNLVSVTEVPRQVCDSRSGSFTRRSWTGVLGHVLL
jgi:hypothetical protein